MITTNHNSPNGAPYLRHARERGHRPHDGWTVTVKIAIPKPRHWLVCSTGWILMCLVYLACTLWIGGFHTEWYMSNNISTWNNFLPQPVTTFLPIRAVHDTDDVYAERPWMEPQDSDPFVSSKNPNPNAETTSTWPEVVPSSSDSSSAPIVLSESKEEIEASGLTLPGSNPTNIYDENPAEFPTHEIVPENHVIHEQNSRFHPVTTEVDGLEVPPSNSSDTTSESLATEPTDLTTNVDFEVVNRNVLNKSLSTVPLDAAPVSDHDDHSTEAKDETSKASEAPAATVTPEVEFKGFQPEATGSESGEHPTVHNEELLVTKSTSEIPVQDVRVDSGSKDKEAPWSRASSASKEFYNSSGDESHLHTRKHENATSEVEAPALTAPTGTDSQSSDSAPPTSSTSSWNPSPAQPDSETRVEETEHRKEDIRPPSPPVSNSDDVEPVIRATKIKGRTAVEAFRNHLDCFSESGKWVYDPTPRHLSWNYVGEHYLSHCDIYRGGVWGDEANAIARDGVGDWSVRDELKWVWQTNQTCPLYRVDRNDFCRRLGPKRNIMLVGDSLNHGLSESIMNHLILNGTGYEPLPHSDRISDGVYDMCDDIFGPGNGLRVSFVRNDRLSLLPEPVYDYHANFHEYPWLDLVDKYNVQILILNRGAHYENDTAYEKSLRKAFTVVRDRFPNVQVIYRNTPPGHANCTNVTAVPPLKERQEFGWDGVKWPDFYSWGLFAKQNVLARKIVEEFQYIYMDVDTMLALRADGHPNGKDCLHYCMPGPFDVAVQLLYNMLPFL